MDAMHVVCKSSKEQQRQANMAVRFQTEQINTAFGQGGHQNKIPKHLSELLFKYGAYQHGRLCMTDSAASSACEAAGALYNPDELDFDKTMLSTAGHRTSKTVAETMACCAVITQHILDGVASAMNAHPTWKRSSVHQQHIP